MPWSIYYISLKSFSKQTFTHANILKKMGDQMPTSIHLQSPAISARAVLTRAWTISGLLPSSLLIKACCQILTSFVLFR